MGYYEPNGNKIQTYGGGYCYFHALKMKTKKDVREHREEEKVTRNEQEG